MHEHRTMITAPIHTAIGSVMLGGAHLNRGPSSASQKGKLIKSPGVILITRGSGSLRMKGRRFPVKKGDAVLLFPGETVSLNPDKGSNWDELYVVMDGTMFRTWFSEGALEPNHPVRHLEDMDQASSWLYMWMIRMLELHGKAQQMRAIAALHNFFAEIATAPGFPATKSETWLERAKSLLVQDMKDDLSMKRVAQQMGMNYEAFRKRFQSNAGVSPLRFRNENRIEAAKQMMSFRSAANNREIAAALGFADEFHFSKRFREITGMSPKAYRKSISGP